MVAILEEDLVTEIFVERERHRGVVGNIYKGRVSKVLPGMQCAFIDIGLERDGFLYVSDVVNTIEEFDRLDSGDDEEPDASGGAARAGGDRGKGRDRGPQPKIEELLKEGQEIVVQVAKEPLGTKGARLTSHATLAGRFLVFMPTVDHVGVSRKIESRDERNRLRGIVRKFREEHGFGGGVIIRTAAGGRPEADILSDLALLQRDLEGHPPQVRVVARAGGDLPRAEPGRQTAPRPADRRVFGDPHRQRAGTPARDGPDLAHHAEPRVAGEALHQGLPDLRGVRRPGRDRQSAEEQGVAQVRRLDRHQPDRSARRDRRQHRTVRRQAHRAAGRHDREDESRGGRRRSSGRSACATSAASSCSTSSTWRSGRTGRRCSRPWSRS